MEKEVLVYVKFSHKSIDGAFVYSFFFSDTPEYVWGPDWDVDNPSINGDLTPEETTYSSVYQVKTTFPLKTIEETSCYSIEYATYGIMALAWIDIENMEEYPEHGRMTLYFGDSFEKVSESLGKYNWEIEK